MNVSDEFQQRISFRGDLKLLLTDICQDYAIGKYIEHEVKLIGYEDFNVIVTTDQGKYFFKFFTDLKSNEICKRYIDIIEHVLKAGINHPKFYRSEQGLLYIKNFENNSSIRLVVLEYLSAHSFFESKSLPSTNEIIEITKQAAKINQIIMKPIQFYDEWAIVNFVKEYDEKHQFLEIKDQQLLESFYDKFKQLNISELPTCFVHGDIIKTNVLKDASGEIYIIDYSCANIYPRIQELAVMLCDLFFDSNKTTEFLPTYNLVLEEYQKINPLSEKETKLLPIFVQAAHAMHVLLGGYDKNVNNNNTSENEYYLNEGRKGLEYTLDLWNT